MKRAMDIVPVIGRDKDGKEDPTEQWSPFQLKVRDPAIVRMITTVISSDESTIIPVTMGKPAAPELKLVPALVFETDPEGKERTRHYVWLAPGIKLTIPFKIVFVKEYIDEVSRNPMFLYEAFKDQKGE